MFPLSYPEVLITYCTWVFCSPFIYIYIYIYLFFIYSYGTWNLSMSSNSCIVIIKKNNYHKKRNRPFVYIEKVLDL